ncbi:hypothetical protein G7072_11440 [Nocardioides sp. HDW12B]|uniref:hypothetical protein n=1 Tax=Nocardioides sp. HDW12B TaxID=2714939 RepID=UPI00140D100D|nr:hypothetical protein [Nocardioides sp. HDW12B]QIK66876.1 hypothetical protein G7072_11440 [Nocardioides sp. HDW12B]
MKQVLTVLAFLAGLGVAAGVVWGLVVETPQLTRDTAGVVTAGPELAKQIDSDAWFAVLGLLVCVPAGMVMALRTRTDPVVGVLSVVAGAILASGLCVAVGLLIGPGDPIEALRDAAPGEQAPAQLTVHTWVVLVVWPLAAALGSLVVLLLKPPRLQQTTDTDYNPVTERSGPESDSPHRSGKAPS